MKKSTKVIAITTLVLGLSTTVFAFAGNGHWRMTSAEKAEFVNDRIANKLELTEVQKSQLSSLTDDILELVVDMKETKNSHQLLVEQLLSEPTLDQSKALNIIYQTTQLINDKAPETIASLAGFLDSLNVDQRAQLQGFVEKRMKHHHAKH